MPENVNCPNPNERQIFLFLLWEASRHKEEEILEDIAQHFKVLKQYEVAWPQASWIKHLEAFYGHSSQVWIAKARRNGTGNFRVVIVEDTQAKYDYRDNLRGMNEWVNINIYDAKKRYRKLIKSKDKIHSSVNLTETRHNLAILLGMSLDDFLQNVTPDGAVEHLLNAPPRESGWKSLSQLFYILNETVPYVVMRNFENLLDPQATSAHDDIDLMVSNRDLFVAITGARKTSSKPTHVGHLLRVDGTLVVLAQDPKGNHSDIKSSRWVGSVICVYEGRGTGQYRFVTAREGREWTVDRPWDVEPDAQSVIGIIPFMGSVFFIGNTMIDAGIVQTYKTSIDNVFAENRFIRSSGLVILCGRSDKGQNPRQVSWYNQGLDNEFPEGMDWGGRNAAVSFSADNGGGAAGYWGPVSMGGVARRNVFHNMGLLRVGGCWDVLVEHCAVRNSSGGIRVDATRGDGSPQDVAKGAPRRVLFRKNDFTNVDRLYDGNIKPETYLIDSDPSMKKE